MRSLVLLLLLAGCLAPAHDLDTLPRDAIDCDPDPDARRSVLPSHPGLAAPDAPDRLAAALAGGSARAAEREGAPILVWRTREDLSGSTDAQADALVVDALVALDVDPASIERTVSRWEGGGAIQGAQPWREQRLDALHLILSDGPPYNESTLRIGPILDLAPAERPALTAREAERIAQRYIDCARAAAGAPEGDAEARGLVIDGVTLAWDVLAGTAGPECGWPDQARIDAFTGGLLYGGPSCVT